METTESCKLCEKVVVTLEAKRPLTSMAELPTTFDARSGRCVWKFHEFFGYALVPRSFQGVHGEVDLYLCIDEDDFDDIDVSGYVNKFFRDKILPHWTLFNKVHLVAPNLSPPDELMRCRKFHHRAPEEQS
jgi:hypothetical protein